MKKKLHF